MARSGVRTLFNVFFAVAGQQGKVRIWSRKGRALSARLLWAYSSAG